jgi:hypothetical protein
MIIPNSYKHFKKPDVHVFAFWNESEKQVDLYIIEILPNFRGYLILSHKLGEKLVEEDMTVQTEVNQVNQKKSFKITTKTSGTETSYEYDPVRRTLANTTDETSPTKLKLEQHTFQSLFDAGEVD